jgi:hypothetical protein
LIAGKQRPELQRLPVLLHSGELGCQAALPCPCCCCWGLAEACVAQAKTDWLDNKHVVFGRILGDGMLVMRKMENVMTGPNNKPKLQVVIAECGEM